MTSATYLEHYLDSLEHLPNELQRNFTLMRDLDKRAQSLMQNIDSLAEKYMKNSKSINEDDTKGVIQNLFNKAKEYGDDKVQLAIQTYELVDKHIRRLDNDLARFESEIQDKAMSARHEELVTNKKGKRSSKDVKLDRKRKSVNSSDYDSAGTTTTRVSKKKRSKAASSTGLSVTNNTNGAIAALEEVGITHTSEVLDMPVDPNEPTYCLCHQVSYGEMIGCDNPDCPIEWFHFACVGLTTKPKGKWYCPKCTQDRKKK